LLPLLQPAVDWARAERQKAQADNPFLALERLAAHSIIQGMDLVRDLRDAAYENTFLSIYGTPWMRMLGQAVTPEPAQPDVNALRELVEVQQALECMERGDLGAAVIRMLILLAGSRGSVRRDRLERSAQVLNSTQPFQAMGPKRRAELIQQQSLIAEFEPQRAIETLPVLLKTVADREQALDVVNHILGARSEMEPHSLQMIQRMEQLLGVAPPKAEAAPASQAQHAAKPAAKTKRTRKEVRT
jgi:tellurite resistance protein